MRVTMNIFSGRPNPEWPLTRAQAGELIERVVAAGAPIATGEPPVLGFRGFTVNADLTDVAAHAVVPARFIVPPPAAVHEVMDATRRQRKGKVPMSATPSEEKRSAALDLSQWLFSTATSVLDEQVLEAADAAMRLASPRSVGKQETETRERRAMKTTAAESMTRALEDAGCEPFLTPVNAAFWDNPPTQLRNNCYNYATNFASNTLAQPGRHSGHQYTAFECSNVSAAAGFDGYLSACHGTVRVVALGIWPGVDFHWWRLHPAGFWAHKIGTSPVAQRDNLGRILGNGLTPENCDRGPYTLFCGFYFGPLGVEVF